MLNLNILIDLIIDKYDELFKVSFKDPYYMVKVNFINRKYNMLINNFKINLYNRTN